METDECSLYNDFVCLVEWVMLGRFLVWGEESLAAIQRANVSLVASSSTP